VPTDFVINTDGALPVLIERKHNMGCPYTTNKYKNFAFQKLKMNDKAPPPIFDM